MLHLTFKYFFLGFFEVTFCVGFRPTCQGAQDGCLSFETRPCRPSCPTGHPSPAHASSILPVVMARRHCCLHADQCQTSSVCQSRRCMQYV